MGVRRLLHNGICVSARHKQYGQGTLTHNIRRELGIADSP